MNKILKTLALILFVAARCPAIEPGADQPSVPAEPATAGKDAPNRADRRYEEMLSRMQSSIEDIAQMYGNPVFLQIFTNDVARASELKERLHAEKGAQEMQKELRELTLKREGLMDDIALKDREAARLTRKLAAQRAALDALAGAIEQARTAVEDTSK
jgi:hypothetical protein